MILTRFPCCVALWIFVLSTIDEMYAISYQPHAFRCYSCTTMNADRLLSDVEDEAWKRWLENVRFVPRAEECNDNFDQARALRSGVMSQECNDGVCLKVWFRERKGSGQVWRTCIPNAGKKLRPDCTRIISSEGEMEVCTCNDNLCNSAIRASNAFPFQFLLCVTSMIVVALINARTVR